MELKILGIVLLIISVLWVVRKTKKRKQTFGKSSSRLRQGTDQRVIFDQAIRLATVIEESIELAENSGSVETKLSRLSLAKSRLEDLRELQSMYSFIKVEHVDKLESAIQNLDAEFQRSNYEGIAEGNSTGQALEKEGKIEEALAEYERLLDQQVDTPFTYRRLAIIYSKKKDRVNELRVIRAAIANVPAENAAHYKWFAERLAKKSQ